MNSSRCVRIAGRPAGALPKMPAWKPCAREQPGGSDVSEHAGKNDKNLELCRDERRTVTDRDTRRATLEKAREDDCAGCPGSVCPLPDGRDWLAEPGHVPAARDSCPGPFRCV